MNTIKTFAIAAGLATLAACGGGAEDDTMTNMDANLTTDMNATMPADNLVVDANNVTVVNGADMNAGMDMNVDMNATANNTL